MTTGAAVQVAQDMCRSRYTTVSSAQSLFLQCCTRLEESMGGYRYFVVCFYLEVVLRGQEQIVVVDAKGMASLLLFAFSKFCLR